MTTLSVDLNADLGESFGPWPMGDDAALLRVISSANVACGVHAGDWDVMAGTMAAAVAQGVGIGAHPGFPDLQGFGRREMQIGPDSAANLVRWQLGAAQAMARAAGGRVRHLKLHGALANMASRDAGLARACFQGALSVDPDIVLMVLAGTAQQDAARELGARAACEIFADRAYNPDATLVDRRLPGAVIHDPAAAAARVVRMVCAGAILPEGGHPIPTRIDTICLHGDTPGAVQIARAVRAALADAGIAVGRFTGARLD
ncbi:LamB/YcsF family protein [Paracoccus luteus]|uniref:LamB/YcsF family protein n=1 Tax=Paracoccus luteus TaxID=2508543 RepID=UPI00106FDB4C|nr:5-oxoprolinase subunit PxpA [Paracoccus luteus]